MNNKVLPPTSTSIDIRSYSYGMRRRCILCGIKSLWTDQLGGTSSSQRADCRNCCLYGDDLRVSSDDTRHGYDNQASVTSTISARVLSAWRRVPGRTSSSVAVACVTVLNGKCHRNSTDSFFVSIDGRIIAKHFRTWKDFSIHCVQYKNCVSMCEISWEIGQKWVPQNKWNNL